MSGRWSIWKRGKPLLKKVRGVPPPWYGWVSPFNGIVALIVSFISLTISRHSLELAQKTNSEATEPRVAVTSLQMSRAAVLPKNIILRYNIHNYGQLTVEDVEVYETVASGETSQTFNSNWGHGFITPGQDLPKVVTLLADSDVHASYDEIVSGKSNLTLQIRVQFHDQRGRTGATCESFVFQPLASQFTNSGRCKPLLVPFSKDR